MPEESAKIVVTEKASVDSLNYFSTENSPEVNKRIIEEAEALKFSSEQNFKRLYTDVDWAHVFITVLGSTCFGVYADSFLVVIGMVCLFGQIRLVRKI